MKTIYALLEPDTRRIRYVGATGDPVQRLRVHWSSRLTAKKTPVVQWVKTLNHKPELHVLQEVTDDVAHDAEEYWISLLRQVPSVDLLNSVDTWHGSRSTPGRERVKRHSSPRGLKDRFSPEQLEEIRQASGTLEQIAERYGISHMSVSRIKRGTR